VEISHQLSKNHVLLSVIDPAPGAACRRVHHMVCLTVLLTAVLTLTAVWYGLIYTASQYELMTGTSIFRISDTGIALVVALISFLLSTLLLEIYHCSKRNVCTQIFTAFISCFIELSGPKKTCLEARTCLENENPCFEKSRSVL